MHKRRFLPLAFYFIACLAASAGILTGSFSPVAAGSNVNLTVNGKLDWVHWGLYTETSVNRKACVTPQISNYTLLGDTNGFLAAYQYADNSSEYSWQDGAPAVSVTNTTTGVWSYGVPTIGTGLQLTLPADQTNRTLQVFVGAFAAKGQFHASLDDGTPGFTSSPMQTVNNFSNGPGGVFTINFAATTNGHKLTVEWTLAMFHRSDGNVTLQAALLTAPEANNPPFAMLANPVPNAAFSEPANLTLNALAEDFDGTVTNVAFYSGATKLGQKASVPYSFTWNNVTRGRYTLTARATDNAGVTSCGRPVEIFVYGTGGGQTNTSSLSPSAVDLTTEGTADWTHWGLLTNTSFNHKGQVSRKISNFTPIGSAPLKRYADNYTAFAWSDGTPTPATNGTRTGVFITGTGNGFQLTAPADPSPRQLRVYVGGYGFQGEFQAWLSDLSARPFTDTSVSNIYDNSFVVYTINYTAASAGQQMNVVYRSLDLFDLTYGNVTLQAATLQGGAPDLLPVSIINPARIGSDFVLSFSTVTNRSYTVQYADLLPAPAWTNLAVVGGDGALVTVTNFNAASGQRYYRVETQ